MKSIENNKVMITGEICSNFEFSHEIFGERFYIAYIQVMRESGTVDTIPFVVSDRLLIINDLTGVRVDINGQFRSHNKKTDTATKLILFIFARDIQESADSLFSGDENRIELDGYIGKEPVYRKTPLGWEIADVLLAVNRPYGKSDYIPCVCWGRNARFAIGLELGTRLGIVGRIQSREYQKKISDNEFETRTAYEVSISQMSVVGEPEEGGNEK